MIKLNKSTKQIKAKNILNFGERNKNENRKNIIR